MKHEASDSPGLKRSSDREIGRTNLRAQGVRTRQMIVRAATKILLQTGGLDFTLRGVAREAKISISNLQYYFPDREALLRAVMAPVIDGYLADLDSALNDGTSPRAALQALMDRQLRNVRDVKAKNLWLHFAALAGIDPECSRLFDEWYDALARGVAKLVTRVNPALGPAESMQFALLFIAMCDGLGFVMRGKRLHSSDLDESFRATIDFLLQSNPLVARGKLAAKNGKG